MSHRIAVSPSSPATSLSLPIGDGMSFERQLNSAPFDFATIQMIRLSRRLRMKRDWLVEFPHAKLVFAGNHVDRLGAELHSFEFTAISLLSSWRSLSVRSRHQRQPRDAKERICRIATKKTRDERNEEWITGSGRNPAIRADSSDGDRDDDSTESIIAHVIWFQAVADHSTLKLLLVKITRSDPQEPESGFVFMSPHRISDCPHSCVVKMNITLERLARSLAGRFD